MDEVLGEKGEGVMIKDPACAYEKKRSRALLKVKKFEDTEAVVTGHQEGTGKYKGMMGALNVKDTTGAEFKVGSGFSDAQRKNPVPIGQTINFKFQGRSTYGVPRFPIFIRVRDHQDF
jgi:DNA ligase-1